ncbi:MAG: bacillithiol biosynthesis cysteine-adding enzyme BshC [Chitinophagales bacterium]
MDVKQITFAETGYFSETVIGYLNGAENIAPFVPYTNAEEGMRKAMEAYTAHAVDRPALVKRLQESYRDLQIIDAVDASIHSLSDPNTYCIVTAHQLNIFTGPLYVMYKALAAVRHAALAKKHFPDRNFVPVFWLGSEDHDFAEINHFHVYGQTITWEDEQGGACGQYVCNGKSMIDVLDKLDAMLDGSPEAKEISTLFRDAYLHSADLGLATHKILHHLFGPYGMLIVDGDDAVYKKACADIISDELFERSSERIVQETIAAFPYPPQATPREINLFYLQKHIRERIVYTDGAFHVLNTGIVFSEDAMRKEMEEHPERFSPNVILRPLFQQRAIPAVMFIGGGGELAYWLLLKDLFARHNTVYPAVQLRDSFLFVDEKVQIKMNKLQLKATDFFGDADTIIRNWLEKQFGDALSLDAEKEKISAVFANITEKMRAIDASMESAVLAEQKNLLNSMDKLEAKLRKAEKTKQETAVNQIRAIHDKLFPGAGLQERHDNVIPLYLKFGRRLFDILLEAPANDEPAFVIIQE